MQTTRKKKMSSFVLAYDWEDPPNSSHSHIEKMEEPWTGYDDAKTTKRTAFFMPCLWSTMRSLKQLVQSFTPAGRLLLQLQRREKMGSSMYDVCNLSRWTVENIVRRRLFHTLINRTLFSTVLEKGTQITSWSSDWLGLVERSAWQSHCASK